MALKISPVQPVFVSPVGPAQGASPNHAWCYFDGTVTGTHAPSNGVNVTTVTRTSAGLYVVTLTSPVSGATFASCNLTTAIVSTNLVSASSFQVRVTVAGTPTDSNEVKAFLIGG